MARRCVPTSPKPRRCARATSACFARVPPHAGAQVLSVPRPPASTVFTVFALPAPPLRGLRPRTASRSKAQVPRTAWARLARPRALNRRSDFSSTRCHSLKRWCGGSLRGGVSDLCSPRNSGQGWTDDALRAGALAAGLSPASVGVLRAAGRVNPAIADAGIAGLLPRGAAQLVEHFLSVCDRAFLEALERRREEFAGVFGWSCFPKHASHLPFADIGMRTQHRVAAAVRMRLEMLKPYIVSWPQALSLQACATAADMHSWFLISCFLQAQPQNVAAALRHRAALVDEIWHAAGASAGPLRKAVDASGAESERNRRQVLRPVLVQQARHARRRVQRRGAIHAHRFARRFCAPLRCVHTCSSGRRVTRF